MIQENKDQAGSDYQRLVEPLCRETEKILDPVELSPHDRLEIGLDDEGLCFVVQAYSCRRKKAYSLECDGEITGIAFAPIDPDMPRPSASFNAALKWAKRVPERKEAGYGRWVLKATDFTVLVISHTWPRSRIKFKDGAETVYDFLLTRFMHQTLVAKKKALFKVKGIVPEAPEGFVDHPNLPLLPYQLTMHHTAVNMEAVAYFAEQGTGKTPPAIHRIMHEAKVYHKRTGKLYRAVVVCPKNVRSNWSNELERFATVPGKCVVLRGGKLTRIEQLIEVMTPDDKSEWAVVICSYETVRRSWNAISMIEWNLAIADESQYIKNPRAQRSKVMLKLRDRAAQRMVLTGTPYANNLGDLWCQLEFLGDGLSGFSKFEAFREYYHRYVKSNGKGGKSFRHLVGFKNLPLLHERLARLAFVISKKEALPDLPDRVYDIEEVEMAPKQRELYVKLQEQLAAEIEHDLKKGEAKGTSPTITATHILTKLLRLSQITAGYAVADKEHDDDGELKDVDRMHFFEFNPKMDAVIEMLKNKKPTEKTIIWTCWVPIIKELAARCDAAGIKAVTYFGGTSDDARDKAVKDFNTDFDTKVFIGNPAAGGTGLNLPGYNPDWTDAEEQNTNADHVIFYACNWSMIHRSQAEGRNHGKDRNRVPVRITDLCIPGTIDEEIRHRVLGKQAAALEVQDLRKIMERLLDTELQTGD